MSASSGGRLRLATRGSALARWQSGHVASRLRAVLPDLAVEEVVVQTTGDADSETPLFRFADRGLFTREVDRAVLDGEADAAVHSLKDLPTALEPGLALAAVLEREDPRDALVSFGPRSLGELPEGAIVGTSSLRRRSQLLSLRPDLAVEHMRGNVDTRVRRVREGVVDAAILALAGLRRLGLEGSVVDLLDPPGWLPAPGQGALAILVRQDDARALETLRSLDDAATRQATSAERSFLAALEGGCQVPVGALATCAGDALRLCGFVGSLDGRDVLRAETSGSRADPDSVGRGLAAELLERGAGEILRIARGRPAAQLGVPAP